MKGNLPYHASVNESSLKTPSTNYTAYKPIIQPIIQLTTACCPVLVQVVNRLVAS